MKKAGQMAQTATKYPQRSTVSSTKMLLPESLVMRLWEKLRVRYRDQWTKRVGTDKAEVQAQIKDWQEVLGGLTPQEISNGWDKWDSEFPPNSLQYRTACRTGVVKASHQMYKALPRPKNKEVAANAICGIREMLK